MSRRIIILTWVSASWKTSIQNELLNRWWKRPINFSTRKPRSDNAYDVDWDLDFNSDELNEYVFIDRNTFSIKMINWDFVEITQYWGNFYGVSETFLQDESPLKKENICIILDPIGRSQLMERLTRECVPFETYYIYISQELQEDRLSKRWDKQEEIIKRRKDFNWFHPTNNCVRINGDLPINEIADFIINRNV